MPVTLKDVIASVQNCQVGLRSVAKQLKAFGDPQLLMKRIAELEGKQMSFREFTMLNAEKTIPFKYRIEISIQDTDTARLSGSATISEEGYFFLDRVYFSFLASDGTNAVWRPVGSSHPVIAVAAAAPTNALDFFAEFTDGRAQRERQERAIPGDIYFRQDGDGILGPEGDAFGPNSTINTYITPTHGARTNDGTLYITLEGVQCLDYLKG
jgi:hypothetical protein